MALDFSDDVCPTNRQQMAIEIRISPADMRKVLERRYGPVFRIALTEEEWAKIDGMTDWTAFRLRDGKRVGVWRPESELAKLRAAGQHDLVAQIEARRIDDSVE